MFFYWNLVAIALALLQTKDRVGDELFF